MNNDKKVNEILQNISKKIKEATKDYLFSPENEKKEKKKIAKHFKDVYGNDGYYDKNGVFHTKISIKKTI